MPAIPPADLARIAVPTTLIWGRHDLATPLSVAEAASARYGWPLHVIENCTDDPPIEQPEALLRALRAALGGADAKRGEPRWPRSIRRDRGGRALRRLADGDAAGPQGLPGAARRPRDLPERHGVHPRRAPAGRRPCAKWGLLDRLAATGCPPIHTYSFDFGPFTIAGAPGTDDAPVAYCPRRTMLDKLLVDAAAEAGAEVREGFTVEEVLIEDGRVVGISGHSKDGSTIVEHARVVVGADGRHSLVAEAVRPEQYNEKPPLLAGVLQLLERAADERPLRDLHPPDRGFAAAPTHDDLTLVIAGWPYAEFEENKKDIEGNYLKTIELAPAFADRLRGARREARFVGAAVPNYFRKPYGPGWALVGDAGYNKDFITGARHHGRLPRRGTLRDRARRVLLRNAPVRGGDGRVPAHPRRTVRPMYEFTCQLATLEPPPPELQQLLGAVHGNQEAMDGFARMNAGTISPAEFFAPENVDAIAAAA